MTTTLIALIRGINVGPSKRVAMGDLRELLTGLGYTDVRTHLQSGNAVFSTGSKAAQVAVEIEGRVRPRRAEGVAARARRRPRRAISINSPIGSPPRATERRIVARRSMRQPS